MHGPPITHAKTRPAVQPAGRDKSPELSEAPGGLQAAKAVIIATGSEVPMAIEAQKQLAAQGLAVRVVSMPSTTVFDRQSVAYKSSVLPEGLPRVAVEAGVTDGW